MPKPNSEELTENSLLEPDVQVRLYDELLTESAGVFTMSGSLEDHCNDEMADIATVERLGNDYQTNIDFSWPRDFDSDDSATEERRVRDSFLRAGIARPVNLDQVMEKLRQIDDVIIGLDTNILMDCLFTASLLAEIYEKRFPNWILLAVPKLAMAEIENQANSQIKGGTHPRVGWPDYRGRIGNRALEELFDLDSTNGSRPGLSLLTVGDLDTGSLTAAKKANWLLDSEIREQFYEFLTDISFHKGTYFLSQDRVNVMMSGTEGAEGLYLQKPDIHEMSAGQLSATTFQQLVYELCVEFGVVELSRGGDEPVSIRISIFWPGKQVSDWHQSRLRLEAIDIDAGL